MISVSFFPPSACLSFSLHACLYHFRRFRSFSLCPLHSLSIIYSLSLSLSLSRVENIHFPIINS